MDEEEKEMENVNPVLYWKRRSRKALESQGVVVPPPPLRPPRRLNRGPVRRRPNPNKVPPGVVHVRHRNERIGLDLICDACEREIPKSETLYILCHFYSPDGPVGSPLTRCYVGCPYCYDDFILGRFIGDADNFLAIAGATQHFPSGDSSTGPNLDPKLRNKAYPDAVLDSPNDFEPRPRPVDHGLVADELFDL